VAECSFARRGAASGSRGGDCRCSSNAQVSGPSREEPETAPFVMDQQSREALLLGVRSGRLGVSPRRSLVRGSERHAVRPYTARGRRAPAEPRRPIGGRDDRTWVRKRKSRPRPASAVMTTHSRARPGASVAGTRASPTTGAHLSGRRVVGKRRTGVVESTPRLPMRTWAEVRHSSAQSSLPRKEAHRVGSLEQLWESHEPRRRIHAHRVEAPAPERRSHA
jgi:hypothetical protein